MTTLTLRPYQQDGLNALWDYFKDGNTGNPLLCWPTGTGKSIVPAIFIESVMKIWPTQRFLLATHVKELIEQNAGVLKEIWSNAPLGIYSAGLKEKNPVMPICYAGIQSAKNNPHLFGHRDIIFIDEAHLINQDDASMYLTFLATMKLINPHLKIIGMTATPFRMGQGYITEGGIFTDIVHDLCSMENFNKLIADGYLAPLKPLRTKIELDVSNVGMVKGDFNQGQLQHAVDVAKVTWEGLREFIEASHNRRSWLLFASGIDHAEHIAEMLGQMGIDCAAVHSKQSSEYNDKAIRAFKDFSLRAIVNYGKLTTGFNHPQIDAIGMFRPTMSVPLWVQMLGRGTRPADGKSDCLVMDYARNTPRLGPINDPMIPRKKGDAVGEVPVKVCDFCGVFNHIKNKTCTHCASEFSFEIKITKTAGYQELIKSDIPIYEEFDVTRVIYNKHQKSLVSTPCLKVVYHTGIRSFTEWLFPQSTRGPGKHFFHQWWKQRSQVPPPLTVEDALGYVQHLKKPKTVKVWINKLPNPEIMEIAF
jgi:DNA repair protein RadD